MSAEEDNLDFLMALFLDPHKEGQSVQKVSKTGEPAPELERYCPLCSKKKFGVRLAPKLTRDLSRWFLSCSNFPTCRYAVSPEASHTAALQAFDLVHWDAVTRQKVQVAMAKYPPPSSTPVQITNNPVEIEKLQLAVKNLAESLQETKERLERVEKSLQENEERRKTLGFEVF